MYIIVVYVCVCMRCVRGAGLDCDVRTSSCTLYCNCVITSGDSRGVAGEADTTEEQQLKRAQSGSSSLSGHNQGAAA